MRTPHRFSLSLHSHPDANLLTARKSLLSFSFIFIIFFATTLLSVISNQVSGWVSMHAIQEHSRYSKAKIKSKSTTHIRQILENSTLLLSLCQGGKLEKPMNFKNPLLYLHHFFVKFTRKII